MGKRFFQCYQEIKYLDDFVFNVFYDFYISLQLLMTE